MLTTTIFVAERPKWVFQAAASSLQEELEMGLRKLNTLYQTMLVASLTLQKKYDLYLEVRDNKYKESKVIYLHCHS